MKKNEEAITARGGIASAKPHNSLTELVFIIDKSGSMAGMEDDTVGGFNSMLEKQRGEEGSAYVTTVLFSNEPELLHDRLSIESIKPLTRDNYRVGGCTALHDAIGFAIERVMLIHKYARPEDVPEHTVFVITTDGMENASQRFDISTVKRLICECEEKHGWEFLFVAANIDVKQTATDLGIRPERAALYCTETETVSMYGAMSDMIACFRRTGEIANNWADDIGNDPNDR